MRKIKHNRNIVYIIIITKEIRSELKQENARQLN